MQTKALFLDRDGTINVDYGYVYQSERFELIDGIIDLCRKAQEKGYLIIVITNQSGIARGYYTDADFQKLNQYMIDVFTKEGVTITDVFYCPELSGPRRKPECGMFLEAQKKYNIDMPIRTMGEYLKRLGFTPQKPKKISIHQNSEAVNKWLNEEYPSIKKQAKKDKALIYWLDETAVQNCSNLVRGYFQKGQTPLLKVETKKMHINMVSAINNTGKVYFKIYKEAMNTDLLKDFCKRLIKEQKGQKILLICDNLKVHHAYIFQDWLKERKDEIEVFYLPSYSPEYNPDEYLNNDLKQNIALKPQAKDTNDIQKYTNNFMRNLSNKPEHVKSYFNHPKLKSYNE